jgi:hypothetical protein
VKPADSIYLRFTDQLPPGRLVQLALPSTLVVV